MDKVVALTVLVAVVAVVCGSPPPSDTAGRWVWGRRDTSIQQDNKQEKTDLVRQPDDTVPQQSILQRRHGRFLERPSPRDTTSSFFKSISARVVPSTQRPLNILDILKESEKEEKIKQKTSAVGSIKPSPIDTTFVSHFDVYNQKDVKKIADHPQVPDILPTLITPGEYPYPFGAKPIVLGDGTSIGWAPKDTLLVKKNPTVESIAKKPIDQNKSPAITDDHDPRYTTLDKLFDGREPTDLPDTYSLSNDVLGGLHPDEVFYADENLVIIKGGGFTTKNSLQHNTNNIDDIDRESQNNVKPEQVGNELGYASNSQVVNVRPEETFASVPLPFRFINGNIPTIVKPQILGQFNRQTPRRSHKFRPTHQRNFVPSRQQQSNTHFVSSSSDQISRYSNFPSKSDLTTSNPSGYHYQYLDTEDPMIALPSIQRSVSVLPPPKSTITNSPLVKRSTNPQKVVHYHYQTRGIDNRTIVNYKIHNNDIKRRATPQNFIRLTPRESFENDKKNSDLNSRSSSGVRETSELEDFTSESTGNLIPKYQVPKKRPSYARPATSNNRNPSIRPVSSRYEAPTIRPLSSKYEAPKLTLSPSNYEAPPNYKAPSNYKAPTPHTITPQWVHHTPSTNRPPFTPSVQLPPNFRPSFPPRTVLRSQVSGHFQSPKPASLYKQPIISLEGDTRVNFLHPRPPINQQAEFLIRSNPSIVPLNNIRTNQNRPAAHHNHAIPHPSVARGHAVPTRIPQNHHFVVQPAVLLHHAPRPTQINRQHKPRFMEPRRREPFRIRQAPRL